jgi:sortase A
MGSLFHMKNINPLNDKPEDIGKQAALDLIKERIRELYGDEPEATAAKPSLVDRFWQQHQDHPNPQAAWQEFYSGLKDEEKQSLWNEYHSVNGGAPSSLPQLAPTQPQNPLYEAAHRQTYDAQTTLSPEVSVSSQPEHHVKNLESAPETKRHKNKAESAKDVKNRLISSVKEKAAVDKSLNSKRSKHHHWKPFFFSFITMMVVLLAQYNPLMIAIVKQYISPGDTLRSPVIVDPNADIKIGKDPRIIIPKINVDVPVVYSLTTRDEVAIQNALEDGVVHYAGSSKPGQAGNNVIVGHSSNNFLNSGKYKFAFVLLDRLQVNDTFILHYNGKRYVYKVVNKQIINPNDFSLIGQTEKPTATLITCNPPGTSWRRLVIQGEQISPTPTKAQTDTKNIPESDVQTPEDAIVPGNSPSLFQRFRDWIF